MTSRQVAVTLLVGIALGIGVATVFPSVGNSQRCRSSVHTFLPTQYIDGSDSGPVGVRLQFDGRIVDTFQTSFGLLVSTTTCN